MSDSSLIPVPVDDPLALCWQPCNDMGNARRLEVISGGLLKWVDDEFWCAFDTRRWSRREGDYRARSYAQEVAQHIHDEVAALGTLMGPDPDKPDARALAERFGEWCTPERAQAQLERLHKWAITSGNATQTANMLKQAQNLPGLRAWSEDFDADPLTYNVANGTLRFAFGVPPKGSFVRGQDGALHEVGASGESLVSPSSAGREPSGSLGSSAQSAPGGQSALRPGETGPGGERWHMLFQEGHEPRDMLMQIAEWAFDPAAHCPQWEERLQLVQPDAEMRGVFPRMYGQTLTGLIDCEEFYVHKGRGGDGKTKTHEIIAHGHGDYYLDTSVKTFLQASFQKSGAEHRSDLVRLKGDVRMIVAPEPPPNAAWDGEILKLVTGGGHVTARGSGAKEEITYKPRWKLFVEINPTPRMPGDDKGFRRRFRLVLWPVDLAKIEGGFEPPEQLRQRLLREIDGILNWMIAGALDWLGDRRVPVPEAEAEALVDFWAQSSPFGNWLDEECDLTDRDAITSSKALRESFLDWCDRNEVDQSIKDRWNATRFGKELSQRQILGTKDGRGYKVRKGIKLLAADPLGVDGANGVEQGPSPQAAQSSAEPTGDFSPPAPEHDPLADDE